MCSLCIIEKTYYLCTVKKPLYLFLVLGLLTAGCTHTSREPRLVAVDSMLATRPDSALALLNRFDTTTASQADRMYYRLLLAQAMNKTDSPLAGKDPILHEMVDYYDWWGNANERMKASYMLGCAYRDEGDAPLALKHYRNAVDCADTMATDCDFHTLSRIYGQMANLFNMQRAPRLQLDAQRKAVYYARKAKDTLAAIIFYENLSLPYHMLNQMDSALYYSQKAAKMFKDLGHKELAARTLGLDIDIYLRQKNYTKVKGLMDDYEQYTMFFDQYGNIEQGRDLYYYYKGLYFEGVGQLDSAEFFYRKLLSNPSTIENRQAAYDGLLSLFHRLCKNDSIAKYSKLYCQISDSASFAHSADEITRMHSLYNYDASERKAVQHEKEANTYRTIIFAIIIIVILGSYFIYRFAKRQKRLKMQELAQANTAYSSLLSQYTQILDDLCAAQQGFDKYRTEKEKAIQQLQQELSSYQEDTEQEKKWDASQAMLHNAIVIRLHKMASRACKATEEEWRSLNQFAINNMSAFLDKVCDEDINLTEKEIRVSILTRLQFIPSEMAVLLNLSKQRITNIKANANKKRFNKAGAQTFDTNINSFQ